MWACVAGAVAAMGQGGWWLSEVATAAGRARLRALGQMWCVALLGLIMGFDVAVALSVWAEG